LLPWYFSLFGGAAAGRYHGWFEEMFRAIYRIVTYHTFDSAMAGNVGVQSSAINLQGFGKR